MAMERPVELTLAGGRIQLINDLFPDGNPQQIDAFDKQYELTIDRYNRFICIKRDFALRFRNQGRHEFSLIGQFCQWNPGIAGPTAEISHVQIPVEENSVTSLTPETSLAVINAAFGGFIFAKLAPPEQSFID